MMGRSRGMNGSSLEAMEGNYRILGYGRSTDHLLLEVWKFARKVTEVDYTMLPCRWALDIIMMMSTSMRFTTLRSKLVTRLPDGNSC